jgi:hypothetical protein
MPLPSLRRMQIMSHRYPAEQRERATRMALERLDEYGSAWALFGIEGLLVPPDVVLQSQQCLRAGCLLTLLLQR